MKRRCDSADWGLDNVPEHVAREHACLRVQARVSDRFGLRAAMAPTTPYRDYYAALPADPLHGAAGDEDAVARAAAACARFDASAWRAPIEQALSETAAAIGRAEGDARAAHPLGFALGPAAETCGTCAWAYDGGRGVAVTRCRQSAPANGDGARTARGHRACVHWEAIVDCRTCGACCREAYHSVTVSMRDPVIWQEPDLIVRHGPRFEIRREGSRCAALVQMGTLKGSPEPPAMGSARQSLAAPDAVWKVPATPARSTRTARGRAANSRRAAGIAWMPAAASASAPRRRRARPARPRHDPKPTCLRRSISSSRSPRWTIRWGRVWNARSAGRADRRARCACCAARWMRARAARWASGCACWSRGEGEALSPAPAATPLPRWPAGRAAPRVVVVGAGPAGSWAALRLAEAGVPVTIVEQGKPVQPRRRDLALITRGQLTESSNYCFGEGGAGTYSDGKLYTRAKDREGVADVIADLVRFGAPDEIAIDSRPHVGSNRLPRVLEALRDHLVALGVDYRFEASVAGLRVAGGRVRAVRLAGGDELPADVVVLAVGHSARPVYAWAARGRHRAGTQADRDRCAHRTSATADRRDPVRRRGRAPEAAARRSTS